VFALLRMRKRTGKGTQEKGDRRPYPGVNSRPKLVKGCCSQAGEALNRPAFPLILRIGEGFFFLGRREKLAEKNCFLILRRSGWGACKTLTHEPRKKNQSGGKWRKDRNVSGVGAG